MAIEKPVPSIILIGHPCKPIKLGNAIYTDNIPWRMKEETYIQNNQSKYISS